MKYETGPRERYIKTRKRKGWARPKKKQIHTEPVVDVNTIRAIYENWEAAIFFRGK